MPSATVTSAVASLREPPACEREEPSLRWPFVAWSLPWWWCAWGLGWWRVSLRQLENLAALERTFAVVAPWAATIAVLARFAGVLLESAFYAAFWRARGARLPVWRYAFHVMLGSLVDLQAIDLVAARPVDAPLSPWRVALAGPAALPHVLVMRHPVLAGAFAGLGLLTFGRWCWVAWAQGAAVRRPLRITLALVAASWLVTHLAAAAAIALAQGRSVVR